MLTNFAFSNLLGSVYSAGNVLFTKDGCSILSPNRNRISIFDLSLNKSKTLPFSHRKNIARLALSPDGRSLLSIDSDGRALFSHLQKAIVLHHFNFGGPVRDAKFSPDGQYIAVARDSKLEIWKTPSRLARQFAPFQLHRKYTGHYDDLLAITWSADSRFILTCSKDMTARLFTLDPISGYRPRTFAGHKDAVLGAFFDKSMKTIYTVAKDGALYIWKAKQTDDSDEEAVLDQGIDDQVAATRWGISSKHYFDRPPGVKIQSVVFHSSSSIVVIGFTNGTFGLWKLSPDANDVQQIHTLSISQENITSVAINESGEWLAFGCSKLGQLLVWEWQSETYILKQQGHYYDMNCLAFSPDNAGQHIATGGDDGKVKIWNASSGFCFVTFTEHTSAITAVEFAKQGSVIFSASLDGTVRAFDLLRYRNFRVFTCPDDPIQFNTLAVDPSGEIVCAAGSGASSSKTGGFEIFCWSTQTGKIIEILSGHEGPVSCLSFSPNGDRLASSSWDGTMRTWELFGRRNGATEEFSLGADGLAVTWRPDGKEIAVANLNGQVLFFDAIQGKQMGLIEGRRDISGGRKADDRRTAANSEFGKAFTSLAYTADGNCVLAGGNSKHVCLYDVKESVLLRRWEISQNLALEGTQEFLDSRKLGQNGQSLDLMDVDDDDEERAREQLLPGARSGDMSKRKYRPEVRSKNVRLAPSGRAWACASTEGLLIYSLDHDSMATFDPFELDVDITPEAVQNAMDDREFLKALVIAFRLNEKPIIRKVYESTPVEDVQLVCRQLPAIYAEPLVRFIAGELDSGSRHIEFNLRWTDAALSAHGSHLKGQGTNIAATLRSLSRGLSGYQNHIAKLCDSNTYALQYILEQSSRRKVTPQSS